MTIFVRDTTKPTVKGGTRPHAGATGVSPTTANVLVVFFEPMRGNMLNATTVKLVKKGTTQKVAVTVATTRRPEGRR